MKKILFITHDAHRTGAPILLLSLIKLLKQQGYTVNTLVKVGKGPLLDEFRTVSKDYIIYNRSKKNRPGIWKRRFDALVNHHRIRKSFNVDLVVSNTITNGDILPVVRKHYSGPIFSYIHELEFASKFFTSSLGLQSVLSLSNHFIAPSNAVKNFLVKSHNVPANNVSILNYYIPEFASDANSSVDEYRSFNNITASFIVGALGTADWRKSPDLFVEVALGVFNKRPNIDVQFIWQGANKKSVEYQRLEYDLIKSKLCNKVVFVQSSPDVSTFFKTIDLFLLTSREDPYPLVVLEAASFNKPTICFKEAGGAVEFVEKDNGSIVDYLDTNAMAERILQYIDNKEELLLHGANAHKKLIDLHQNKELILQQFETIIKNN